MKSLFSKITGNVIDVLLILEMVLIGVVVGALSGFFGIGGGTVLVPLLLLIGYDIKTAIGISVTQMVFSSVFGSYLNFKNGNLQLDKLLAIGLGGFSGALLSGLVISTLSAKTLEHVFLAFVVIALARMLYKLAQYKHSKDASVVVLFLIGAVIGVFSMSVGVGGSLLLVPVLVGFFHFKLKKAISAGLFFVVFSSVSGFISLSISGHIEYLESAVIGIASLIGVYGGIYLNGKTSNILQKRLLLAFYITILSYLLSRVL